MSKDETGAPTGIALTHLDPAFREPPDEYLNMLRSRELVHQDRMFDRLVLTLADDIEIVMTNRNRPLIRRHPPGLVPIVQRKVDETFWPLILHMDDSDAPWSSGRC